MEYNVKKPKWAPKEWIQNMSAWNAPDRLWIYEYATYDTEIETLTLVYHHENQNDGRTIIKWLSKHVATYLLENAGIPRWKFLEWETNYVKRGGKK